MLQEIVGLRANFGGGKNAINRHSQRYYHWPHVGFFSLDKTLDGSPPFYELTKLRNDPREASDETYFPPTVPVDGKRYFGDGLTWGQAEKLAAETIQAKCEDEKDDEEDSDDDERSTSTSQAVGEMRRRHNQRYGLHSDSREATAMWRENFK